MTKIKYHINYTIPLTVFILLLISWEFLPKTFNIPTYIFPRLSQIYNAIVLNKANIVVHFKTTLLEATIGFILGSLIGFLVGVAMAQSKLFSNVALPYVIASNAIPVIAIAPIIILWFGQGIVAKAIVSAFLCFFPLVINTYKGLNEYNLIYKELFQLYGASHSDFLLKFKLSNAVPYIISGLKLNATFAVVGAVVGEFIGANAGLGFGMLQASYSLNTPRLWGYILISCLLGVTMYLLMYLLELYLLRHRINDNN
ncbi:MAG: binding-protein-dependent transport system inner rane component [Bacteroidota bacterium]|nr:binding-protein-dependent transport system inner rane component [Bacteroidota bacterium]